jgi:ankyrin repeat protein
MSRKNLFLAHLLLLPLLALSLHAETLNEIFLETAESGEIQAVQRSILMGADINVQRKDNGWSALMLAAYNGRRDVVNFLLSKGAEVDIHDKVGQTPLMAAVSPDKPDLEIIRLLLKYGAGVNIQRKKDGWTALMLAAKSEQIPIVKILLEHKADLKIKSLTGETAFDIASKGGAKELTELLK